jgi:hypothetical protein
MEFISSPLGVLLILGIVAVAAVAFEPAKFVGDWRELGKRYATDRRPSTVAFPGEKIEVGSSVALPNVTQVDAAIDDDGFWLVYDGPSPGKAPDCIFLPWDCVRYRRDKNGRQNFQLRGRKPIELWVSPELGAAMQRRSLQMPTNSGYS